MDGNFVFLLFENEFGANANRLTRELARDLCNRLGPFLQTERSTAILPTIKILSALFFYAYGSYQKSVGTSHLFGLSQASVSRYINLVSNAIYTHLLNTWVKFPTTNQAKQHNKLWFYERFEFAGVIGVIDCTHIGIVAPSAEDKEFPGRPFINRKGYPSINCQVILHDAAIWSTSAIYQHLIQQYQHGERSSRLLGDSGYPLQPWLFTPAANTPRGNYNRRLASARITIERCIGIWKMKFHCLLHHRILHYDPVEEEPLEENEEILVNISVVENEFFNERRAIRDNFTANNFN
ncbi:hypothetical protein ILUMI_09264 [Ignelater luminosus]|uniref:DDE Tnp4 domain-containing protein n=1 Tax=Ignelater luminosus TaxID=2038154 RepID=A0A8K0D4K9_IGNLU|nr:hypothetical protein ILUMI_09264 [Ignelater luminosus]